MTVVTRNWRGGGGELDLVLLDGETFVFAEVKLRSDLTEAVAAVDSFKVDRLFRAAQQFLRDGGLAPEVVRFDIIAVDPA
ncbi:MAG: YraN family protein, partial [Armatimonadota bacterium]